jgi:hypothetical protein
VKLLKLSIVPAVLLFSVVMAVPVSAHSLQNASIGVACGTGNQAGQVCVNLTGDIEQGNDERFVFVDVFAPNDLNTSLGQVVFDLPAFNSTSGQCANNHCDLTKCFQAITNSTATSFVVQIVKVTSDAAGHNEADLTIHTSGGDIVFGTSGQEPVTVGTTGKCVAPTPTPTPTSTPTPTPSSTTSPVAATTLANTGGFDFRFPLIGLILLVAGGTLYVIGASRGRSTTK